MLKRIQFRNWRSLRDVTLDDLGPITVLIGANSSGKTNIVESLQFLHEFVVSVAAQDVVFFQLERDGVPTLGLASPENLEIKVEFESIQSKSLLTYRLQIFSNGIREEINDSLGLIAQNNVSADSHQLEKTAKSYTLSTKLASWANESQSRYPELWELWRTLSGRMQVFNELFAPLSTISTETKTNVFPMNPHANDVLLVLEFLESRHPSLYAELQSDFTWLMKHVKSFGINHSERETRLLVYENERPELIAPTISAGTLRILAIMTAYYALEMREPELPGLVVMEEPDTSLNPAVLSRLVELLRNYTSRENRPRQFILTTHNPAFLNYFKPEEVRIVSRDEQGYTQVSQVPDHIKEIWLKDGTYALGEIWDMGAFGVPAE